MARFITDCVNGDGPSVTDMVDRARQITWETFRKKVPASEVTKVIEGYYLKRGKKPAGEWSLHIKDDWAVSFYRSVYRGTKCYYIRWSAIEYIWSIE